MDQSNSSNLNNEKNTNILNENVDLCTDIEKTQENICEDDSMNLDVIKSRIENNVDKNIQPNFSNGSRKSITQRRLSLFNLTPKDTIVTEVDETKSRYLESLKKEAEQWADVLYQKRNNVKKMEDKEIVIDESVLSEKQKVYLRNLIDFEEITTQMKEFQKKANNFLAEQSLIIEVYGYLMTDLTMLMRSVAQNVMYRA